MNAQFISDNDRTELLELARKSIEMASRGKKLPSVDLKRYSVTLQNDGASFVTLTVNGALRGCIGALEAYQPLVLDVVEHAAAAAVDDFRFHPVQPEEVSSISIEISVLTKPERLNYSGPDDLLEKLQPGRDGVILKDGRMRATFLPQVWEQLPDKQEFLSHLCSKMGATSGIWKIKNLEVFTYQVEEFHE
jgi:AmmeMemoRadiSam system protein A